MKLCRVVHGMGLRYRLHVANLPGKPDLVFRSKTRGNFHARMFLASPQESHACQAPKIEAGFLAAKIGGKQATGFTQ